MFSLSHTLLFATTMVIEKSKGAILFLQLLHFNFYTFIEYLQQSIKPNTSMTYKTIFIYKLLKINHYMGYYGALYK